MVAVAVTVWGPCWRLGEQLRFLARMLALASVSAGRVRYEQDGTALALSNGLRLWAGRSTGKELAAVKRANLATLYHALLAIDA